MKSLNHLYQFYIIYTPIVYTTLWKSHFRCYIYWPTRQKYFSYW